MKRMERIKQTNDADETCHAPTFIRFIRFIRVPAFA